MFAPFSLGSAILKAYGITESGAVASCGTMAFLPVVLVVFAAVLYFVLAFNPKAFLPNFFDVCSCGVITQAHNNSYQGTSHITTEETKTSREKIGEIRSEDYTEKYDVYADVSRTTTKTTSYDYYKCAYVCPRCRKGWNKTESVQR